MPKEKPQPYATTDRLNRHTEDGREILNPTPMQPPLGYNRAPSLSEQIRQQVLTQSILSNMDPETVEEADDFEIEEDPPMPSRWENDLVPSIKETRARIKELEKEERRYAALPQRSASPRDGSGPEEAAPTTETTPPHAPTIASPE